MHLLVKIAFVVKPSNQTYVVLHRISGKMVMTRARVRGHAKQYSYLSAGTSINVYLAAYAAFCDFLFSVFYWYFFVLWRTRSFGYLTQVFAVLKGVTRAVVKCLVWLVFFHGE